MPSHGPRRGKTFGAGPGDGEGTTRLTTASAAVVCPAYDPSHVADGPPDEPAVTAVGSTPGVFQVDHDGAATYTVPLEVLPGPGGLQPELALVYHSNRTNNGFVGVGFSMAGLSAIARCPRNELDDGERTGILLNKFSPFCLDGVRLVAVHGDYGANGTEYRTLPDSFVRVVSYGGSNGSETEPYTGPQWFRVWRKDGRVLDYGTDDDAGGINHARILVDAQIARQWSLSAVRDRSGNTMRYTYLAQLDEDGATVEQIPLRIEYGGHVNGRPHDRFVGFHSSTRNDISVGYVVGVRMQSNRRLGNVTMSLSGAQGGFVRRYELDYDTSGPNGRSKLERITQYTGGDASGPTGPSKRSTTFTWDVAQEGFEGPQTQTAPLHLETPGLHESGGRPKIVVLDANGDGRDDLAYPDGTRWHLISSRGGQTPYGETTPTLASTDGWCTYTTPNGGIEVSCDSLLSAWPLDYDQDGRTDLLPMTHSDRWGVLLSRPGEGLRTTSTVFSRPVGPFYQYSPSVEGLSLGKFFVDLNGDGIRDLLELWGGIDGEGATTWRYRRHRGRASAGIDNVPYADDEGFTPDLDVSKLAGVLPDDLVIVDTDGDGKEEILYWNGTSTDYTGLRWEHETLDSEGNLVPVFSFFATGLSGDVRLHRRLLVDVNGDGLRDLVSAPFDHSVRAGDRRPEPWLLWVNTGRGFLKAQPAVLPDTLESPPFRAPAGALDAAVVLDYNGDGREDLLVPWVAGPAFPSDPFEQHRLTRYLVFLAERGLEAFRVIDPGLPFASFEPEGQQVGGVYASNLRALSPRALDADGDGQQDLLVSVFWPDPHFVYYPHRGSGKKPDSIVGIREGQNEPDDGPNGPALLPTVTIDYGPLVESLAGQTSMTYQGASCYGQPGYKCYRGPRFVVRSHTVDTGKANDERRVSFHEYKDAKVLRPAHAWLGFAEHKEQTFFGSFGPLTTRTFYDNLRYDKGYRGPHVVETWTYGPLSKPGFTHPGLWLSRREHGRPGTLDLPPIAGWVTKMHPTGATGFAYVEHSFSSEYEVAVPPETLDAYERGDLEKNGFVPYTRSSHEVDEVDDYGNVRQAATWSDFDGVGVTVVGASYANDEAEWLINRPRSVTTTDVTPNTIRTRWVDVEYVEGEAANLVRTMTISGSSDPSRFVRASFEHDASGNVTRTTLADTEGNERVSCTTYEPGGVFPHAMVNALGQTSYVKMHPRFGTPWASVDANGLRTTWAYDELGRLVRADRPGGASTRLAYFKEHLDNEWLAGVRVTEASGGQSETVHDRLGRVVLERAVGHDGKMRVRSTSFFAQGVPAEVSLWAREGTAPSGSTTFGYDGKFRQRVRTQPDGEQVVTRYDGLTTTIVDTRGHASTTTRDSRGQMIRSVDAKGTARTYTYGAFGALVRTQAELPSGALTGNEFDVDAFGRVTRSHDAERGTKTFDYNDFGDLRFAVDALGRQFFYEYDGLGRPTNLRQYSLDGSTLDAEVTYTYDVGEGKAIGRPTRVDANDYLTGQWHQLIYRYDGLGRLAKLDNRLPTDSGEGGELVRVQFGYDGFSRLETVTYPTLPGQASPTVVGYGYGAYGHAEAVRWGVGARAPVLWQALASDEADRVTHERFGNGVETRRGYHPRKGTLDAIATQTSLGDLEPGRQLQSLAYAFDGEGNLEHRVDLLQGHTEHFIYDELDRLEHLTLDNEATPRLTYRYDLLGNVTHKSDAGEYTYDPMRPHLVASVHGEAYGHDAVGNQTARPGGVSVVYNGFDAPVSMAQQGAPLARFAYNGQGTRVRKVSSEGTTTYAAGLYERHRRPDGKVEHRLLVPAPGRGTVAVLRYGEQGGQSVWQPPLFVHNDHLGSTDLVTSDTRDWLAPEPLPPHAVVAERRSYDPFGRPRPANWAQNGPASTPPVLGQGFTGHSDDPELGLVDMKGRVYDPKLGRFLTADPFVQAPAFSQSWNRYAYVFNNPLRFTDPSGFQASGGGYYQTPEGELWVCATPPCSSPPNDPSKTSDPIADPGLGDPYGQHSVTGGLTDFPGFDAGLGPPTLGGLPGFFDRLGRSPPVQYGVGVGVGVAQGLIPGYNAFQPPLQGPPPYEFGRGVGMIAAGVVEFFGGGGIATGGVVVCATGVGCLGGAPAAAVGVATSVNGMASVALGNRVVQNALHQSHSFATRPGASAPAPTVAVGSRPIGDPNARGGVYALQDPKTNQVMRTGQTNNLRSRLLDHAADYPDLEFRVLFKTDNYAELRGLESFADEYYGHPPLNAQNPIYPGNANADIYP